MKVKGKLLQLNLYMLTKLQKKNWKNKKTSPTEAQSSLFSPNHHPFPSTKASQPRCLLENSGQKLIINKHFKFLNKSKLHHVAY